MTLEVVGKAVLVYDAVSLAQAVMEGDEEKASEIGTELAIAGGVEAIAGIIPGSVIGTMAPPQLACPLTGVAQAAQRPAQSNAKPPASANSRYCPLSSSVTASQNF